MGIVRVAYGYGQSITKVFICIGYPIRRYRCRYGMFVIRQETSMGGHIRHLFVHHSAIYFQNESGRCTLSKVFAAANNGAMSSGV